MPVGTEVRMLMTPKSLLRTTPFPPLKTVQSGKLSSGTPCTPILAFLKELLANSLVLTEDWDGLPPDRRDGLLACDDNQVLLDLLVENGLLTRYQVARIAAGKCFGLVLGNYRLLERLGAGGMGVVFKAEHVRMRRLAAIKVLSLSCGEDPQLLARFYSEMRAVAQLQHPNIVGAIDAGEATSPDPDEPVLHYFVMEYVPGKDLEAYVASQGPLPAAKACEWAYQVASALDLAHQHHLIHRDIKPSNILITSEEQAKLLDFGLARHFRNRMTEPGTVLGTVEFMAPEQARDAATVDIRADIYGLGATLFWCVTGRTPFALQANFTQDLMLRLTQPAPSVREVRSDVPAELDAVIARMMAINPDDRYPNPQAVMRALLRFLRPEPSEFMVHQADPTPLPARKPSMEPAPIRRAYGVLVVDDEADVRNLCCIALAADGLQCEGAAGGAAALELVRAKAFDLVLLDIDMPGINGLEVCRQLREAPPAPNLKIVMFSGRSSADELAQMLLAGADDYVTKPFSLVQLLSRIKAALHLKDAQDRADLLNRNLLAVNSQLEQNLTARDSDLVHARNALVLALAKLVEHRDSETGKHLLRLQRYSRCLAEEAARLPLFAAVIDENFVQMLECCAPLHDIGKVGLPDHILLKPGKLTAEERLLMQSHTIMGAETLQEVAKQHGSALAFLQMAMDITRHHHERYDGNGYPDRLAGNDIPLAARLVTFSDVYDALRSRRVYKPALPHAAAVQIITESEGQFDPALLSVFRHCAVRLGQIYQELAD